MTDPVRPSPTPEQERAASSLDVDVMLEAGAGTGKTSTLVDRYVRAALQPDIGVRRILAFTFTEAAASELRGRVRTRLRELGEAHLASGDVAAREHVLRRVRDSSDAPISTIHGFCQRVLRTHPLAAGIDPRFAVLSESEGHRLTGEAFEHALAGLVEAHGPDAVELVAAFGHDDLEALIRALHDELRSSNREPRLPPTEARSEGEAALRQRIAELGAAAERAVETIEASGSQAKTVLEALDCLGAMRAVAQTARDGELPDAEALHRCGRPKAGANVLKEDAVSRYRDLYDEALSACRDLEGAHRYSQIAALLEVFAERYAELKADRSVLDFEDLQVLTVRLLERRPDIADRYRARFAHVMVDEFQDTNGLQVRLIDLVTGEDARVFRVGDRLQSIYGFRHADLQAFDSSLAETAKQEREGAARVLRLSGNFRSSSPLLEQMNSIGDIVLGEHFEPARHLVPGADRDGRSERPVVDILVTDDSGWKELDEAGIELLDPARRDAAAGVTAEARAIALALRRMHEEEGVPLNDMVVLLRAFTHAAAYEEALERLGLNPLVLGGKGFWSHQQVADVRCMLGAIANPSADEPVLGLLASPAVGVSPDALWLLRALSTERPADEGGEQRHPRTAPVWSAVERWFGPEAPEADQDQQRLLSAVDEADAGALRAARRTLIELREGAHLCGLEELIDRSCAAFGYDLAVLTLDTGRQRMANVRKLMRIGREFEANEGRDLRGFLAELDAREQIDREGQAVVAATEHDGVRVMTVHTAKGLEFPVVAVPELGRRLLGGRAGDEAVRVSRESDSEGLPARVGVRMARLGDDPQKLFGYEDLEAEAKAADLAEELRLFWVAITRAEDHLVLSGRMDPKLLDDEKRAGDIDGQAVIDRLLRGLGVNAAVARGEEPAAIVDPGIRLVVNAASEQRARELAVTVELGPATEEDDDVSALTVPPDSWSGREPGPASVSPSSLALYERCSYRFFAERVLGLGRSEVTLSPVDDTEDAGEPRTQEGLDEAVAEAELGSPDADEAEVAISSARRYGAGRAVHELLEEAARADWEPPTVERITEVVGVHVGAGNDGALRRVSEHVAAWLGSPLLAELRDRGATFRPEVPFALTIGETTIRGVIDLVCELTGGETLIVDYKTDRVTASDLAAHAEERYAIQRASYALAVARQGASTVGTSYVFLERPSEPVGHEFTSVKLEEAEAMLGELLKQMAAGAHAPTDTPHRALCHDCPARRRLCVHGEDVTLAPAAA